MGIQQNNVGCRGAGGKIVECAIVPRADAGKDDIIPVEVKFNGSDKVVILA